MSGGEFPVVGADGDAIFTRRWPPPGRLEGSVVVLHGIGEHSGRYQHVAERLAAGGYAVRAMDFRGHGRSPGRRGDLRFAPTLDDIAAVIAAERRLHRRPVFLYGHSLGGFLALLYTLVRTPALAGVIVTGPALQTALHEQRAKVAAARLLGRLVPGLSMPSGLDDTLLSRDPDVLAAYRSDPLVHRRASLGFAFDAVTAVEQVKASAGRFPLPLLIVHGGDDRIAFLHGSQEFAAGHVGDCTLRVYDGVFHSVEHEPEHGMIIDDVLAWMGERVRTAPPAVATTTD